jgi:hypothetical protein
LWAGESRPLVLELLDCFVVSLLAMTETEYPAIARVAEAILFFFKFPASAS